MYSKCQCDDILSYPIFVVNNKYYVILCKSSVLQTLVFRRKLLTTAQYIYKTLFQEEKGSDITVFILGRAWRLHKVYISQVCSFPTYLLYSYSTSAGYTY